MSKRLAISDQEVMLQIWDTAGQENFHQGALGSAFYRGCHGAILVFDLNNEKSFDQLSFWRDEMLSRVDPCQNFPVIVIGNKTDLVSLESDLNVNRAQAQNWCLENGFGYFETSAKEGIGVDVAVESIASLVLNSKSNDSLENLATSNSEKIKNRIRVEELYVARHDRVCVNCS